MSHCIHTPYHSNSFFSSVFVKNPYHSVTPLVHILAVHCFNQYYVWCQYHTLTCNFSTHHYSSSQSNSEHQHSLIERGCAQFHTLTLIHIYVPQSSVQCDALPLYLVFTLLSLIVVVLTIPCMTPALLFEYSEFLDLPLTL